MNKILKGSLVVHFDKNAFYRFYVEDEDSDMDEVYHSFDRYFGRYPWILSGTVEEIEDDILRNIWPYPTSGGHLVQRWFNEGMISVSEE